MTIQTYEQRSELATPSQDVAVHRLAEWAQSAQAAHQIATTLVQTSFCPDSFRNKPGEATAAILAGIEVGLQPMAALRSFDIIQGQAAARAITLRAIVQSQGHEIELVESTATRCRMRGRRRGSEGWQEILWTIERARDLNLTGKPNWKNQPQTMLVARATSEICRLVASDAILGLAYSVEDLDDGVTPDQPSEQAATVTPIQTRTMQRRQSSGAEEAPESGRSVEPSAEPSAPESEPLLLNTRSKLAKAMYAGINDAGIPESDRIPYIVATIGREIESTKEMTEDEARLVLATLDDTLQQPFPEGEPS